MAHTINLRTNELGYIILLLDPVTDNIVSNDVVVPDFNVCTNTYFLTIKLNRQIMLKGIRYKPHRIVKDSHLKDAVNITALTMLYEYYTQYQYLLVFYIASFFLSQKDW